MSTFIPTIPLATDKLSKSQGQLKTNNQVLDDVFGVDHYTFSNGTSNKGFHTNVTTPDQASHPSTAVDQGKLYSVTPHASIGSLQFSRGESDAYPTPITMLHGTIASASGPNQTAILNLIGTPLSMGLVMMQGLAAGTLVPGLGNFVWDGTTLKKGANIGGTSLTLEVSGTSLLVQTNSAVTYTNIYWSIQFFRCGT